MCSDQIEALASALPAMAEDVHCILSAERAAAGFVRSLHVSGKAAAVGRLARWLRDGGDDAEAETAKQVLASLSVA